MRKHIVTVLEGEFKGEEGQVIDNYFRPVNGTDQEFLRVFNGLAVFSVAKSNCTGWRARIKEDVDFIYARNMWGAFDHDMRTFWFNKLCSQKGEGYVREWLLKKRLSY